MEDTQLLINKSIVVLACFLFVVWVIYWIASLSEKNKKIKEQGLALNQSIKQIEELSKSLSLNIELLGIREKDLTEQKHLLEKGEMKLESFIKQQKTDFDARVSDIRLQSNNWAIEAFNKFKKEEIEKVKAMLEENANRKATLLLQKWKVENEAKIRLDARNRSYGVTMGKIAEQLMPFNNKFPFNPKDARFIGSPIDLIVFDGLADGLDRVDIYFIEVKTGKSRLNARELAVKAAVEDKNIFWLELNNDTT
jgi:predicted Holliday junction resolvase-like endonuclease